MREARIAFIASVVLFATTALTLTVAVLTPPLSGPFCVAPRCFAYPYADTAARFPRDFLWMYPAMLFAASFVAWVASLHSLSPRRARVLTLMGLCAAVVGAATLLLDYFVQLAVVQPSLLAGERDGIALLSQYNPHGLFIALEEVGYLLVALAFAGVAPAFGGRTRLERALRFTLVGGCLLAFGALGVVSWRYGLEREYRFEVAVITIDVVVLLAASGMAAMLFRRGAGHTAAARVAS